MWNERTNVFSFFSSACPNLTWMYLMKNVPVFIKCTFFFFVSLPSDFPGRSWNWIIVHSILFTTTMEPAFVGAGKAEGQELWRIESLKPVKMPKVSILLPSTWIYINLFLLIILFCLIGRRQIPRGRLVYPSSNYFEQIVSVQSIFDCYDTTTLMSCANTHLLFISFS